MAQNLETLYVYNSPSITNLNVFDDYQYLEYAIFNNTAVTDFPNLAGWGSVKYFELSNSKVSELPDWSSSSNLLKVNVTGNYIDFADGSVSAINEAVMEAEGIEVVRSNQKSLSKVTLTSSNTKPQAYADIVLTAAATSTIVDIEDGAEYKFEASYKGGDWTTISELGSGHRDLVCRWCWILAHSGQCSPRWKRRRQWDQHNNTPDGFQSGTD